MQCLLGLHAAGSAFAGQFFCPRTQTRTRAVRPGGLTAVSPRDNVLKAFFFTGGTSRMSRLGELLVREKMISLQQLQEAQTEAKRTGRRLGVALSRLGYVNDQDLTQFLARQYSLPSINLNDFEIDGEVLKLVPKEVAMKHMVVPVNRAGAT